MKTFTCIVCPNGCEIDVKGEGEEFEATGALCVKGTAYVRQELTDPRRTLSSLVKVQNGDRPLVAVRLTSPVPRDRIREVMDAIQSISLTAPVQAGQTLRADLLGLGSDLVTVDAVEAACAQGTQEHKNP